MLTTQSTERTPFLFHDSRLNRAVLKAQAMTDEERYQAGFDHGFHNKGMRGSLSDYPAYVKGWGEGYRARF